MQSLYSPQNLYSGFNYYWFDSELDFSNQQLELKVLTNPYENVTPQLDLDNALLKLNNLKKEFETLVIDRKLNFIWNVTKRINKLVRFDTSEARKVLKEWCIENESSLVCKEDDSDDSGSVLDIFKYNQLEETVNVKRDEGSLSADFNVISLSRGQFGIESKYQLYDDEKHKFVGVVARTIGLDEVALMKSNKISGWSAFKRVGNIMNTPKLSERKHDENSILKKDCGIPITHISASGDQPISEESSDVCTSVFSSVKRHSLDGGTFTDARYQPVEFIPSIPGPSKSDKYDEPDVHPSVPIFCDSDYKMLRRSLYEPRLCYYSLQAGVHFVTPRFLPGHQNPNKRNHDYFLIAIDDNHYNNLTPTQKCHALFLLWKTTRHYYEVNSVPVETLIGHENSLDRVKKLYASSKNAMKQVELSKIVKEEIESANKIQRKKHIKVTSIMQKIFKN